MTRANEIIYLAKVLTDGAVPIMGGRPLFKSISILFFSPSQLSIKYMYAALAEFTGKPSNPFQAFL